MRDAIRRTQQRKDLYPESAGMMQEDAGRTEKWGTAVQLGHESFTCDEHPGVTRLMVSPVHPGAIGEETSQWTDKTRPSNAGREQFSALEMGTRNNPTALCTEFANRARDSNFNKRILCRDSVCRARNDARPAGSLPNRAACRRQPQLCCEK